jgi:hypothetical protein
MITVSVNSEPSMAQALDEEVEGGQLIPEPARCQQKVACCSRLGIKPRSMAQTLIVLEKVVV